MLIKNVFSGLFIVGLMLTGNSVNSQVSVVDLRCELLVEPQGIDCVAPRLSWELVSDARDVQQTKYRILVASSLEKLNANEGDLWDSKNVKSNKSLLVPYSGVALASRMECYWKVKVKTSRGASEWSKPSKWTMGLLQASDWQARWTGWEQPSDGDVLTKNSRLAARYLRKEFKTEGRQISKAVLYISGLGLYEAYLNGKRIGEQVLSPTPTDYDKSVRYNTFDVTSLIASGNNAFGIVLGNGRYFGMRMPGRQFFGYPKLLLQLEITYADGTVQTMASDGSWKVNINGPIRANNEFDGEEHDARLAFDGWDRTGFDDSKWAQAELVAAPAGKVEAQLNRNIKVMETIKPVAIKELQPGIHILDMGQNMVGWLRMKVSGKAGDEVKLRFAETLQPDGSLYVANLRGALVTDKYTLCGKETEIWEPSFTYHGFRFVEITGFPQTPALDHFEGRVVYDEMETTGEFETSNATLNQIFRNAYWGIRGNYRGMPTDCPQRDERMGWLGDRAIGSHGESFIFNNHLLYAKWLDDIEQSQREDGSIPDVAPNYWIVYSDNMTWPGTYLIIANMLYEQFGDIQPIARHYASMKKWMTYMRGKYLKDNIMVKDQYGDWCMPPESPELIHSKDPARKTDGAVLGTTFYYRMLTLLERFATLLDKPDEAATFAQEAQAVKLAFNEKYLNRETKQYSNNTVTANILPLCFGMTPETDRTDVFRNIVEKTTGEFKSHISTGLVGAQWIMRGLTENGRPDLALTIATNRDYPSWGFMIENGATTIWELWNGNAADPEMNSGNHVMLLGDLIVWYYEYLAGIRNEPSHAGFKQIVMKPYIIDGLDYVKASYRSVHGMLKSHWRNTANTFKWDIVIPANTTALVYIPATNRQQVSESGRKAASSKGVKFVKMDGKYAIYQIGSGIYSFNVDF